MNCKLCEQEIEKYDPAFHQMKLDEQRSVDLCPVCIDRFLKWQSKKFAVLFPTRAAKKIYGKDSKM